jgi:hypothetical protein
MIQVHLVRVTSKSRASVGWVEPDVGPLFTLREKYYPGDVGLYFGLKPTDAKEFADMQNKKLVSLLRKFPPGLSEPPVLWRYWLPKSIPTSSKSLADGAPMRCSDASTLLPIRDIVNCIFPFCYLFSFVIQ